jgi:4-diphosphocytidyl-2-C-methyl-D-erythritol kinase
LTAQACAKINLHLAVHGRRTDGYHALTTVFQSIALHDTLTVEPHDGPFTLACDHPDLPTDASNLVSRAAALLAAEIGCGEPRGVRVILQKRVPTQAGLGGGSADAVATLRLLAAVWGVPVDAAALVRLGARLGSDVPFFAVGGTALGTGRGDEIAPLPDLPVHALAILRPPFGVATAAAYGWLAERSPGSRPAAPVPAAVWPRVPADWADCLGRCRNDFEPVVAARHPEILEAVRALDQAGAVHACLSGSGSAVVGLFRTAGEAERAGRLADARPGWQAWTTRTLTRREYTAATTPAPCP